MVMPVATPMAKVAVKMRTQKRMALPSASLRLRWYLVAKMAKIRPRPMDNGTKMKWYATVSANWIRESSATSDSISMRTPSYVHMLLNW